MRNFADEIFLPGGGNLRRVILNIQTFFKAKNDIR